MATRPNMPARDSTGNQVSLLNDNDDPSPQPIGLPYRTPNYENYSSHFDMMRSHSNMSAQSNHPSPRTPGLQRSDSYDSNITNDPISPLTPHYSGDPFGRSASYTTAGYGRESNHCDRTYKEWHEHYAPPEMPTPPLQFSDVRRQSSGYNRIQQAYDPGQMHGSASVDGRTRRYACRYNDSHGCEKTFTTSGHASRHSKIHSAEKAVNCTFLGCSKKFTRADNMKQHLETHNKSSKDRSRQSGTAPSKTLTRPGGVQKSLSRPSSTTGRRPENAPYYDYTPDRYPMHATHSPVHQRADSNSGLDALANVAASSHQI